MSAMVRVVVVDDEPTVYAHLRMILGSAGDDIEVAAVAYDGPRASRRSCASGRTWCLWTCACPVWTA